ncbi:MAG: type II toxin-antitoxin system RelE/ParE family toxin [Methylomonas lenta]|nr:type II toxin-antitoxin system RelE/ParE family toxin [Methylomonas lenta]
MQQGKQFYEASHTGIGDYFFDSLLADIESLSLYAGIHEKHFGLYRMLAKRFPYAIYYDITDELIVVIAALDLRRNPVRIRRRLSRERSI